MLRKHSRWEFSFVQISDTSNDGVCKNVTEAIVQSENSSMSHETEPKLDLKIDSCGFNETYKKRTSPSTVNRKINSVAFVSMQNYGGITGEQKEIQGDLLAIADTANSLQVEDELDRKLEDEIIKVAALIEADIIKERAIKGCNMKC